jgi:plastocyanin domain-containing protein
MRFIIKKILLVLFIISTSSVLALEESYNRDVKLDVPYQEHSIIVSRDGFFPNRIVVFKGEKVRFFVTAVGVDSACFNIPDKNVFASANSHKIVEAEAFFDKVGIFQFNCPNNTFKGRVMVLEKPSDKEETTRRGLASDVVKVWKPKDTPSEWVEIKRSELNQLKGMGDVMDLDKE